MPTPIRSTQVPPKVLDGLISMALLGRQPEERLWKHMCLWADLYGGDVLVEFDEDDQQTPRSATGYRATQLRFVSPR